MSDKARFQGIEEILVEIAGGLSALGDEVQYDRKKTHQLQKRIIALEEKLGIQELGSDSPN